MSHPKRLSCTSLGTTDGNGSGSGSTSYSSSFSTSTMKKARPHHQSPNPPSSLGDHLYDDDSSPMIDDADDLLKVDPAFTGPSTPAVAANLSRKKATPPQPAKKFVIKLNKDKPRVPMNFEEETWAKLKSAITAIFFKLPDTCDFEKLYQAVSNLCLYKMGGNLYQRIEKECETHIATSLKSLVGQSPDLVVFLSLIEMCWQDTCNQLLMTRSCSASIFRCPLKSKT